MAKSEEFQPRVIPLNGRLILSEDPVTIGDNFQSLKNLRYTGEGLNTHPQGVGGMTKINTTAPTTYNKVRSAIHFQKQQPTESHILVQAYDTGISASRILDNKTVPPAQGDFESASLFTDGAGAGTGRFSNAPGGNVAYCNGVEACIWGGDEHRVARFINYHPDGSFRYDFTNQVTNTLTDAKNVAVLKNALGVGIDSNTVLMLHMDGADASTTFTDSSTSPHTVTAVGDAQIDTAQNKFGGASGLFDGTGDYLTIPDHADFDFSGGVWTVDCWVRITDFTSARNIFLHKTDSNNYMTLRISGTPPTASMRLLIVAGGSTVISASVSVGLTSGIWHHVEFAENGDTYLIFLDGQQVISATSAGRTLNYTGDAEIGRDELGSSLFMGHMDELRISNGVIRHTSSFEPSGPYSTSQVLSAYIGSVRPLKAINVTIETANATTGTLVLDEYTSSGFSPVSNLTDGTAVAGAPLAQTGNITFDSTESTAIAHPIDKIVLYWYRLFIPEGVDTTTAISSITVDAPFQTVKDIWDGVTRKVGAFYQFAGSTLSFQDNTVNVFDDTFDSANTATFAVLDALTTSTEHILVGFHEQMMGMDIRLIGGSVNTTANTIISVFYWNGTAYTLIAATDGTNENSISFAKSGVITWTPPDVVTEFRREVDGGVPLYFYKIEFDKTLSGQVEVFHVSGIPAQKEIKGFSYPMFADNRLWLLDEVSDERNACIVTAENAPDVYNGSDTKRFNFGDEKKLTAGAWLYNQIGDNVRSIKIICKANETWVIEGTTPSTWIKYQLSDKIGCISPETMATTTLGGNETQQVAIWRSAKGFVLCDGRSLVLLQQDIRQFFDARASISVNISRAVNEVGSIDHEKMEYHWLFSDGSNTTHNRELVYDILRKRWFEIDRGSGKFLQYMFPVSDADGNNFMYGTIDTGFMERLENGTDFDSSAITHEFHIGDSTYDGVMYETLVRNVKLVNVAKTTTANSATITHYGDTKTTGTDLAVYSPKASGKRLADVKKSESLGPHVFHSFKGVMTTNDETVGFEPLVVSVFYKSIRKDLR